MTKSHTIEVKDEELSNEQETDVDVNPHAIAGAWEATENVPVPVAVAITNEYTENNVTAQEGEESDGDVVFEDAGILFEEKAVGVCHREVAEQYAQTYIELDRDNKVLAISPSQIFVEQPL